MLFRPFAFLLLVLALAAPSAAQDTSQRQWFGSADTDRSGFAISILLARPTQEPLSASNRSMTAPGEYHILFAVAKPPV
ncbi:MAG: hypothetical protein R3C16_10905 [Hyphomonadaceae bacterium]